MISTFILDSGSHYIRTGLDKYNLPHSTYNLKKYDKRSPIHNGIVVDWHRMEEQLDYIICEDQSLTTSNLRVLVTEPPLNSINNRKQFVELMLEKYMFQSVSIMRQPVLSMLSCGITEGIVIDIGDELSYICSVIGNDIPLCGFYRYPVNGSLLTKYTNELLRNNVTDQYLTTRDIEQIKASTNKLYMAESQHSYNISKINSQVSRALLDPMNFDIDNEPLTIMLQKSINSLSIDCRNRIGSTILLVGGSTKFSDLGTLLQTRSSAKTKIIHSPTEADMLAWKGGVEYCRLDSYNQEWWDIADYHEKGVELVIS